MAGCGAAGARNARARWRGFRDGRRRWAGVAKAARALGAVAIMAACGGELPDAGNDLRYEVVDSPGYPLVVNRGPAPRWALDVDLVVGGAASGDEGAPDAFGEVTSVAIGPGGRIWVADGLERTLGVFDPDGTFVRSIGRQGEGPGEFSSLYSVAFVGDTVLVLDFGNGRIAELSPEGEWLGQRAAPGGISGPAARLRFFPLDGQSVAQWSLDVNDGVMERVWVAHGAAGPLERWALLSLDVPAPATLACDRADGGMTFFSPPFAPEAVQIPSAIGRQWVGWSGRYEIAEVNSAGDTLRALRRERDPVPITDAEWAEGTREYEEFRAEWGGRATCEPRSLQRPPRKAAFRSLLRSTTGELWVEAHTVDGTAWEIFDPDGRLVGTVPGFPYDDGVAPYVAGRRIVWVERDEVGLQRVVSATVG